MANLVDFVSGIVTKLESGLQVGRQGARQLKSPVAGEEAEEVRCRHQDNHIVTVLLGQSQAVDSSLSIIVFIIRDYIRCAAR